MKILITGAHFTPALAVIEELKKYQGIEIAYVGRIHTMEGYNTPSIESQVLPEMGVKFIPITAGRLQRGFGLYTISSLLKIPVGFIQAFYILFKENPGVILSFGGYVGLPIVFAGWLLNIPIIIHEQTLVSGLANKISSLFADKIALSFTQVINSYTKTFLTGNPLRFEILNPVEKITPDFVQLFEYSKKVKLPVILIMGGNQGSHIINNTVEQIVNKLTKIACIIHVTGDNKFGDFERLENFQNNCYLVKKWIGEDLGHILSKIDLVISRAGMNTLCELAYFHLPALVIPLPNLYQDEQMKNAEYFEKLNLVKILPQSKLSAENLLKNIKICFNDLNLSRVKLRDQWNKKLKDAKKVIIPDAAKRIALETVILANTRSL